ncbi:Gfo/Idh/MocA family oxidoreductase [Clostridium tyrobutyricum]|uniref:Gfo/Idh/MocA family protein n=1 Tax=Clostridium tyrobutyricum TaxID=1519 RepID=UPI001C38969B|nr:Gfo/Idh/MocA family oxidoreductase [Clostridium tyrobutyricum]MBV4430842.1 Gfo/Idh/MocA family oxidoreductase [Clostridium tyrobutyricum]
MDLKVGVIGTGGIGQEHIRRLTNVITGAKVTAVSDINEGTAQKIAEKYGAKFYKTGEEVINAPEVDAVVIASWDQTHAGYVLESIKLGKYVFCEKPLATTADECKDIMNAEIQSKRHLVQVGFMRRFDRGYRELKEIIKSGKLGSTLMIHACHRNLTHIPSHTTDMTITNSGIHEIDISRWLLDEEYESGQVLTVKQNCNSSKELLDPQIIQLKTKSGVRIDVEVNMSSGYGYDIQCEIVCEKGAVRLPDPNKPLVRYNCQRYYEIYEDWSQRFIEAYDIEFQEWVNSVKSNKLTGPNSWDGYIACVTADALIKSRNIGAAQDILTIDKPQFYK